MADRDVQRDPASAEPDTDVEQDQEIDDQDLESVSGGADLIAIPLPPTQLPPRQVPLPPEPAPPFYPLPESDR